MKMEEEKKEEKKRLELSLGENEPKPVSSKKEDLETSDTLSVATENIMRRQKRLIQANSSETKGH